MVIGYTTGVFDLFHIGHLNILKKSKSICDRLIVGVTTDELMKEYKNKTPVIPFEERIEIVQHIKYVDVALPQESMNKLDAWKRIKFNIMFVGDDWYESEKWINIEKKVHLLLCWKPWHPVYLSLHQMYLAVVIFLEIFQINYLLPEMYQN